MECNRGRVQRCSGRPPLIAMTEDAKVFGAGVWVYCGQHLGPHLTGWCTVPVKHKIKLDATNQDDAYKECILKNYPLYENK